MTEQKAKEKLKEEATEPNWFCPLTIGVCRNDCVCYIEAYIYNNTKELKDYNIQKAHCHNGMFIGENPLHKTY